jgi:glycosyltransferase involved in cell wall biosynthesis
MWAGGAERVISELLKNFVSANVECHLITLDKDKILYNIPKSVQIFEIGHQSKFRLLDKFLRYKQVRKYIKKNIPDVVLSLPEDIGIFVIPSLFFTKIPIVISERNNPWIMPWKKITRFCRFIFYPFASGFIFQTKQAQSFFSSKIQNKSIILPNPLNITKLPKMNISQRKKIIVSVGRLEKQKNYELLIKAFEVFYRTHQDYVLKIYGEGTLLPKLQELSKNLKINEVCIFPGRSDKILEEIKYSTMFVMSSLYEGLPNSLIEAMSIGLPVISTDCPSGGPATLIQNNINGILVKNDDIESLVQAMCKIADDNNFVLSLSDEASKIKSKFDSNIVCKQWLSTLLKFSE